MLIKGIIHFFFELELLDVISQLTDYNIQTNYSNIEISKLFSIFNILKPRLDGKDGHMEI